MTIRAKEKALLIRDILEDKKGEDLLVLDIASLTSVADYFVLVTGRNPAHLEALAEEVRLRLKSDHGQSCYRRGGTPESGWVVVDYVDVVLHAFSPVQRGYYALAELWRDAARLS